MRQRSRFGLSLAWIFKGMGSAVCMLPDQVDDEMREAAATMWCAARLSIPLIRTIDIVALAASTAL